MQAQKIQVKYFNVHKPRCKSTGNNIARYSGQEGILEEFYTFELGSCQENVSKVNRAASANLLSLVKGNVISSASQELGIAFLTEGNNLKLGLKQGLIHLKQIVLIQILPFQPNLDFHCLHAHYFCPFSFKCTMQILFAFFNCRLQLIKSLKVTFCTYCIWQLYSSNAKSYGNRREASPQKYGRGPLLLSSLYQNEDENNLSSYSG